MPSVTKQKYALRAQRAPLVSVVILNWNGLKFLEKCFETLFKQDYPNFEVVMSDNGSSDGSIEFVRKNFPRVRIVENGKNLGFAGGTNAGIRASKGEYVFLSNNDVEFRQKNLLSLLVSVAESDPKIGVVGCFLMNIDKPNTIQNLYGAAFPKKLPSFNLAKFNLNQVCHGDPVSTYTPDNGQYTKVVEIDSINGLIKKSVLDRVGLLDEKFFLYYEEVDLGFRIKKAGFKTVLAQFARLWHYGSASIPNDTPFYIYNMYKSKIRWVMKHFSWPDKLVFITFHLAYHLLISLRYALKGRFKHVWAIASAYGWNLQNIHDYLIPK